MEAAYELFEHTADLGIRVHAENLPGLVAPATSGLYTAIGTLVGMDDGHEIAFSFAGDEPVLMLRDYLAELLFLFEDSGEIVDRLDRVTFTEDRLDVVGRRSPLDRERSELAREVKAVTYHDLRINEIPGGVEIAFIVDI